MSERTASIQVNGLWTLDYIDGTWQSVCDVTTEDKDKYLKDADGDYIEEKYGWKY